MLQRKSHWFWWVFACAWSCSRKCGIRNIVIVRWTSLQCWFGTILTISLKRSSNMTLCVPWNSWWWRPQVHLISICLLFLSFVRLVWLLLFESYPIDWIQIWLGKWLCNISYSYTIGGDFPSILRTRRRRGPQSMLYLDVIFSAIFWTSLSFNGYIEQVSVSVNLHLECPVHFVDGYLVWLVVELSML
jgi:hypothetical protein